MFKGCIMELFKGFIVVDFVYVVYIDVGNSCIVCCINCCLVLFFELLQSGQMVEIVIVLGVWLNLVWLSFVVIGKVCIYICYVFKL